MGDHPLVSRGLAKVKKKDLVISRSRSLAISSDSPSPPPPPPPKKKKKKKKQKQKDDEINSSCVSAHASLARASTAALESRYEFWRAIRECAV